MMRGPRSWPYRTEEIIESAYAEMHRRTQTGLIPGTIDVTNQRKVGARRGTESVRNNDVFFRQAVSMAPVHSAVGAFDIFGERYGIEKRRRMAIIG